MDNYGNVDNPAWMSTVSGALMFPRSVQVWLDQCPAEPDPPTFKPAVSSGLNVAGLRFILRIIDDHPSVLVWLAPTKFILGGLKEIEEMKEIPLALMLQVHEYFIISSLFNKC